MERFLFVGRFLSKPKQVGSLVPSSRSLARCMVADVRWEACRLAVELGPGTGAVTTAILERMRPDARLLLFEKDPEFRAHLRQRFPGVSIYGAAMDLRRTLGRRQADAIISGIPFALLSPADRRLLLEEIIGALAPDGTFVAFQYTPLLWFLLRRYFRRIRIGFTPRNMPPAFVFSCQK